MVGKDKVVAIIPARGGSKSIPRKNLLVLRGKPLIAWPIELAKSVSVIDRVIVSTDDEEIRETAVSCGAEAPFLRPRELAMDETPTLPVLRHCLDYLKNNEGYSAGIVLLLYPTSPFLRRERIEEALALFEDEEINSVVSVVKDFGHFWKKEEGKFKMFYPVERANRQYVEPLYRENGAIYFNRGQVITEMNKVVDEDKTGFLIMDPEENIDIDEAIDLERAGKKAEELSSKN